MNTTTARVLIAICSIFALCMLGSVVYHMFSMKYTTETAYMASTDAHTSFQGVYIRDEEVIKYDGEGAISYSVKDGGKLGCGSTVAEIYSSPQDIEINQKLTSLNNELNILKKIQNPGTSEVAQPSLLSSQISEKYKSIVYDTEKGNYRDVAAQRESLLILMSTLSYITGHSNDLTDKISQLTAEIQSLEAKRTSPLSTITVDKSAYFVSYIDGYEELLNKKNVNSLTIDDIKNVKDSGSSGEKNVIGKLITGYQWYVAGVIDNTKNNFAKDEVLELKTDSSAEKINVSVVDVKATGNPHESIIILSCDKLTAEYVQHRTERMDLSRGVYKGIKVPRKAIRFNRISQEVTETEDETAVSTVADTAASETNAADESTSVTAETEMVNCKGVYVKHGEQISFKKIQVIYEGDDYVLSDASLGDGYLELYDDIIVEGVDADGN